MTSPPRFRFYHLQKVHTPSTAVRVKAIAHFACSARFFSSRPFPDLDLPSSQYLPLYSQYLSTLFIFHTLPNTFHTLPNIFHLLLLVLCSLPPSHASVTLAGRPILPAFPSCHPPTVPHCGTSPENGREKPSCRTRGHRPSTPSWEINDWKARPPLPPHQIHRTFQNSSSKCHPSWPLQRCSHAQMTGLSEPELKLTQRSSQ